MDELIEATMLHLSTVEEVKDIDLLALGTTVPVAFSEARFQVKKSACFCAMEDIRNDKYLARS